jgi:hypothetical protein
MLGPAVPALGVDVSGHSTIGRRLAAAALGLTATTALAGCAIGFRGPAPDVSDRTAFIQGDVLSNRTEQGEAWFKWGTTTAYGQETDHGTVEFQAGVRQGYFGFLSGLDHHTTYHFALCADDQEPGVGAFCSGDQTFTTSGDDVTGDVAVLTGQGFLVSFAAESYYDATDGRGSVTIAPGGSNPVTCLNITGERRFTVGISQLGGAVFSLLFVDVSSSAGTVTTETTTTEPTVCPADPSPISPVAPAFPAANLEINDG